MARRTRIAALLVATMLSCASGREGLLDGLTDFFEGLPVGHDFLAVRDEALELAKSLDRQLGMGIQAPPSGNTSSSFIWQYDEESQEVKLIETSLGPVHVERPRTIGAGESPRISLGLVYSRAAYDVFEHHSLDHLGLGPIRVAANRVLVGEVDLNVVSDVAVLSASYGLTRNLSLGAAFPFLQIRWEGDAELRVRNNAGVDLVTEDVDWSGTTRGLGDMSLTAKYHFMASERWGDLALMGRLKLPTGNEHRLLGTGSTDGSPMLLWSRRWFGEDGASSGGLGTYALVGYTFSSEDEFRGWHYGGGLDLVLARWLTVSAEVLGKELRHDLDTCNLALGFKCRPAPAEAFVVKGSVQWALMHDGLVARVIPSFGLEYGF